MRLDLDFSAKLVGNATIVQFFLEQNLADGECGLLRREQTNLQRHHKFCSLFTCQVHMAKFPLPKRAADLKVAELCCE